MGALQMERSACVVRACEGALLALTNGSQQPHLPWLQLEGEACGIDACEEYLDEEPLRSFRFIRQGS